MHCVVEPLILTSPRLYLRPLQLDDAAPIAAYRSLADVACFQS